jgi:hypothetical protein
MPGGAGDTLRGQRGTAPTVVVARDYSPSTMYRDYAINRTLTWRLPRAMPEELFEVARSVAAA